MFVVGFCLFSVQNLISNSILILYNLMSLKSDALLSMVCVRWLFRSLFFTGKDKGVMIYLHNHYNHLVSIVCLHKGSLPAPPVDELGFVFVKKSSRFLASLKVLSLFFCNIHLNFFRIMKQQNVLFSGRSLVLFLGLIVQLLLSQTAFAQKTQVPVKVVGETSVLTSEQVSAGFLPPSVALERIQSVMLTYSDVEQSVPGQGDEGLYQFYYAMHTSISNGASVFNAIGIAGKKIESLFPDKYTRDQINDLKKVATTLLSI